MVARQLAENGCQSNEVIAVYAPNSIDWIVVCLAALRIGLTVAAVNALLAAGRPTDTGGWIHGRGALRFTQNSCIDLKNVQIKTNYVKNVKNGTKIFLNVCKRNKKNITSSYSVAQLHA